MGAVLSRIRCLTIPRFQRASAKDQEYAGAELQAVVVSWLAELGDRVVHPVRRHHLLTPAVPLQHWGAAAAACGLPVATRVIMNSPRMRATRATAARGDGTTNGGRHHTPEARPGGADPRHGRFGSGTVLVAGNEAFGALANRYGQSGIDAARALGFPLLELRFAVEESETVLVDVNPFPDLVEPWAAGLAGRLLKSIARQAWR